MSSFAIDYFATLGRKDGKLSVAPMNNIFEDDRGKFLSTAQVLEDAITDITVVCDGEDVDDESWEILNSSYYGTDILPPYIAIKRQRKSARPDHISEVIFLKI